MLPDKLGETLAGATAMMSLAASLGQCRDLACGLESGLGA